MELVIGSLLLSAKVIIVGDAKGFMK